MSSWKNLFVPDSILKALTEDNFTSPTPIQALALPSAIRDCLDIVGAAETGSGKTLAFAIPILHHILKRRKFSVKQTHARNEEASSSDEEDTTGKYVKPIQNTNKKYKASDISNCNLSSKMAINESSSDSEMDNDRATNDMFNDDNSDGFVLSGKNVETISLGIGFDFGHEERSTDDDENLTPESDNDVGDDESDLGLVRSVNLAVEKQQKKKGKIKSVDTNVKQLQALILTPTRELAIQVKNHIDRAARYTDITTCVIVGGMAIEKQRRVLQKNPDIVVATPGRFWELLEEETPQLMNIHELPFLVIDEADRMIEKGHFQELSSLLNHINSNDKRNMQRQTFVFSATLTLVHSGPDRKILKKQKNKMKSLTKDAKLALLMSTVGIRPKAKIIDLSQKQGTAESLVESRIMTSKEDKDLYLYYFLLKYPGRTLVFANSKDALRRLVSVLRLLNCSPLVIHADMRQKQRLKNLDRFRDSANGLLLATDVAARGLDIPKVEHVIHFQVPRTSENYVHRSGRTARAFNEGLSVMLVAADDLINYRKIIKTLNRNEELPVFPVEDEYMTVLRQRVSAARAVDQLQHSLDKQAHQSSWFERLADEADIELDEDTMYQVTSRDTDSHERIADERRLKQLKLQLEQLLKKPVTQSRFSGKYPTKGGTVVVPYMDTGAGAKKATNSLKDSIVCKRKYESHADTVASQPRRNKRKYKRKH